MFKTKEIQEINELIKMLEIENQLTVHYKADEYQFINGEMCTDNINELRDKLNEKLNKLDNLLFNSVDDGR